MHSMFGRGRWSLLVGVCAGLVFASGCAPVGPWERATLARPDMELGGQGDLQYGEEHAQAYREGSSGAGSVKSGGCGCN